MKICCACKIFKEESEFYKDASRSCGLQPTCKSCGNARKAKVGEDGLTSQQRWVAKNPEYSTATGEDGFTVMQRWHVKNPGYARASQLKAKYNLSSSDFDRLLAEQGGACAICRRPDKKWCVDHDHETGKVRAILCYCCNIAIGNLGDSSQIATAAVNYLVKHGK